MAELWQGEGTRAGTGGGYRRRGSMRATLAMATACGKNIASSSSPSNPWPPPRCARGSRPQKSLEVAGRARCRLPSPRRGSGGGGDRSCAPRWWGARCRRPSPYDGETAAVSLKVTQGGAIAWTGQRRWRGPQISWMGQRREGHQGEFHIGAAVWRRCHPRRHPAPRQRHCLTTTARPRTPLSPPARPSQKA